MAWHNNVIANMYGPHFLILYGIVIVVTLCTCWLLLRARIDALSTFDEHPAANLYDEVGSVSWRIRAIGAAVIAGLGGYKLIIALLNGRYNVMLLILMGLGSLSMLIRMHPLPDRDEADHDRDSRRCN